MKTGAVGIFAGGLGKVGLFDRRGWQSMVAETLGRGSPRLPLLQKGSSLAPDEKWFEHFISEFISQDLSNSLEQKFAGGKIFKAPLLGFARGSDPLFRKYKQVVGPFHRTPEEVLAWAAREQKVSAPPESEISVVSFILPLNDPIVSENARARDWGAARWAQARLFGEICMRKLMQNLIEELAKAGVLAAAGDFMPDFRKKKYPVAGWASPWSHRHAAFAAGLGSFGMNDAFITEKGQAHRCGSIVVALKLKPNREQAPHYRHFCKHHREGNCLVCASRCPVQAISEKGHDKDACSKFVMKSVPRNVFRNNVNIYCCGLCMAGTPCSRGFPV